MYLPENPPQTKPTAVPAQRSLARVSRMISIKKATAALRAANLYVNRNPIRSGGVCGRLDYFLGLSAVIVISLLGFLGGGFLKVISGLHTYSGEYGSLVLAVFCIFLTLFSCSLILKRVRDIRGTSKNDLAISVGFAALHLVPGINIIVALYLCLTRGRVTHPYSSDGRNTTGRELNQQIRNANRNIHVTTSSQVVGFLVLGSAIVAICAGAALIIPHAPEVFASYALNTKTPRTGNLKARFKLSDSGSAIIDALQDEIFNKNIAAFSSPLEAKQKNIFDGLKPMRAPIYKNVSAKTWMSHPEIKKTNAVVKSVHALHSAGRYQSITKMYDYCSPMHDTKRELAINKSGKVRFFSRSLGTLADSITINQFYDTAGTLRFLSAQLATIEYGAKSEYRVYFDEEGKRIWETKKQISGKPNFPSKYWPEELTVKVPPRPADMSRQPCSQFAVSND